MSLGYNVTTENRMVTYQSVIQVEQHNRFSRIFFTEINGVIHFLLAISSVGTTNIPSTNGIQFTSSLI